MIVELYLKEKITITWEKIFFQNKKNNFVRMIKKIR